MTEGDGGTQDGYQREKLQEEVRGNNCPLKEDQEESNMRTGRMTCDFEVRPTETQARKLGGG